jgi:hypothetical protein
MNRLDTPLTPDARTVKAGAAGKDQLKRLLTGGRDERGSAFGALLKAIDPKKAQATPTDAGKADKANDPPSATAKDDIKAKAAEDILATPTAPAAPAAPTPPELAQQASPIDSAAARLLLGPFQPAETKAPEPRKDSEARGMTAAAALSDALTDMARTISRETHAGRFAKPEPLARQEAGGIALPSQDKAPAPDLSLLTRLSDALKDPAALKEKDPASAGAASVDLPPDDGEAPAPTARNPEAAGPLTVAVTHQETHLPPVMRLSPFQQVIEPIRQAATELAASRSTEAIPELDSARPSEIAAPTKLLHLELRPVELGTITVKMRLSQNGMEMRIEASRAETATMLDQDKEALREIIRASGYSADAVTVETVHVDSMPGDWQRAQHRQDNAQSPLPDGRDGGREFNEFRQGEQGREAPRRGWTPDAPLNKDEPHDMAETGRLGGDPHLYL